MLRKDNWSHWEDETIIEVVLDFAKQKKTATAAFHHLDIVLPGRTKAAVAYHWYSALRPKLFKTTAEEEIVAEEETAAESTPLTLSEYVTLLSAVNLTPETIELINLRIRSLI
jgi:RsfA family transcription factor